MRAFFLFILFVVQFWVLIISNYTKYKFWKTFLYKKYNINTWVKLLILSGKRQPVFEQRGPECKIPLMCEVQRRAVLICGFFHTNYILVLLEGSKDVLTYSSQLSAKLCSVIYHLLFQPFVSCSDSIDIEAETQRFSKTFCPFFSCLDLFLMLILRLGLH